MKLITRYELQTKSRIELKGLLSQCFNKLIKSDNETRQRTNALASIETIQNELASRGP